MRRDEAVMYAEHAKAVVENLQDDANKDERPEGWDDDEASFFVDDISTLIDEASNVEFPGMYG